MHNNTQVISKTALVGIMFMLCNTASLAISDIALKILRGELPSPLIVFLYKFGLLIVTIPWIFFHGAKHIKTTKIHFHILRSFFGTFGAISFAQGLKDISMVSAAAFENLQYIVVVLLGAAFFNDRLTKTKIWAIVLGFVGACIVINPSIIKSLFIGDILSLSFNENPFAKYGYTILAISCWSVNSVLVKTLGNTEHNKTQMFYLLVFSSMWSLPAAFIKWNIVEVLGHHMPILPSLYDPGIGILQTTHVLLLTLMGCCYFIHGIAYFNALKHDLSIVIPFRYTKLIFSGFLGYTLFQEDIDRYSIAGYFLIICASFMLIRYEVRKRRKYKSIVK